MLQADDGSVDFIDQNDEMEAAMPGEDGYFPAEKTDTGWYIDHMKPLKIG